MTRIIYSIEENWSLSNEEVRHLDVTISLQLVGSLSDSQYVLEKSYGFAFVSCIASLDFLEVFQVLKEHLRIKLHLGISRWQALCSVCTAKQKHGRIRTSAQNLATHQHSKQ